MNKIWYLLTVFTFFSSEYSNLSNLQVHTCDFGIIGRVHKLEVNWGLCCLVVKRSFNVWSTSFKRYVSSFVFWKGKERHTVRCEMRIHFSINESDCFKCVKKFYILIAMVYLWQYNCPWIKPQTKRASALLTKVIACVLQSWLSASSSFCSL